METTNNTLSVRVTNIKDLGHLVRTRRKSFKLLQAQLAGLSNVGVRFLSDLENGKSTVEFGKVIQVIQALGLEIIVQNKGWN